MARAGSEGLYTHTWQHIEGRWLAERFCKGPRWQHAVKSQCWLHGVECQSLSLFTVRFAISAPLLGGTCVHHARAATLLLLSLRP
jgi:hypothetical protein